MKRKRINVQPDGCIYEQFVYLPNLEAYPNSSDMKELGDIAKWGYKK